MHSVEELKVLINDHRVKTQSNRLSSALKRMVSEAVKGSRMPVAAFSKAIGIAPGEQGREPNRLEPHVLDIVQFGNYALQIANAIAIGVDPTFSIG